MKITYISHSGFLVEMDSVILLFDYFEGKIPVLDPKKDLYVFVSHHHKDHFNPVIFKLDHPMNKTTYIISNDVHLQSRQSKNIVVVKAHEKIIVGVLGGVCVETLKSTDEGVAFLVKSSNETVYHAGDLNLWKWSEESDDYNLEMSKNYDKEIAKLKDKVIDVAFLPLDPRQGEYAFEGIEVLLKIVKPRVIVPMHLWKEYSLILDFNHQHESQLIVLDRENQSFEV